jgi:hypothetical protein
MTLKCMTKLILVLMHLEKCNINAYIKHITLQTNCGVTD